VKRELATVIEELHDGLFASAGQAGMRLVEVEMRLPMDIVPVFRDGGCRVLADVPRSHTDAEWQRQRSQLHLSWQLLPTELLA